MKNDPNLLTMSSQLVGLVAAAAVDGDIEKGSWVAQNATQYNFLRHQELDHLEKEARECQSLGNCEQVKQKFRDLSVANDDALADMCVSNPSLCTQFYGDLLHDRNSLQERLAGMYFDDSIPSVFKEDLHRYQLQNTSAIGTLTQVGTQLSFESKGVSPGNASLLSSILAAAGGLLGGKKGKDARPVAEPVYKTTKEAKQAAEKLGFKKINETVHNGQAVFKRGKEFITRDLDGHNGGAWKMAESVNALGNRETRSGTFDENLNRIGD
ncbi:toxin C-terminal domain-containing protein [Pseudomonas boanensis]|uniref:toxin C-terminal domain-containing protein n=1 Tax=Metapseudomonas boanensis TaxID=2822138 RepID=UPI0035D40105